MSLNLRNVVWSMFAGLCLICCSDATAMDYVWARTNYGASNINRSYSTMSNGYGGYYVPRNAYGNNYEGRPFTNPDGFIIPSQSNHGPAPRMIRWRRF